MKIIEIDEKYLKEKFALEKEWWDEEGEKCPFSFKGFFKEYYHKIDLSNIDKVGDIEVFKYKNKLYIRE